MVPGRVYMRLSLCSVSRLTESTKTIHCFVDLAGNGEESDSHNNDVPMMHLDVIFLFSYRRQIPYSEVAENGPNTSWSFLDANVS